MNSELKAILRRRRRRADGVPPSPESERRPSAPKEEEESPGRQTLEPADAAATPTEAIRDALRAPPPPPPPGLPPKRRTTPPQNVMSTKSRHQSTAIKGEEENLVVDNPNSESPAVATPTVEPPATIKSSSPSDLEAESSLDDDVPVLIPSLYSSNLLSQTGRVEEQDEESSSDEEPVEHTTSPSPEVEEMEADSNSSLEKEPAVEYEPPPAFDVAAFVPSPRQEEDKSPLESPPKRPAPTVTLRSWPLFETSVVRPTINPLSGNIIVCMEQGSTAMIHEFDATSRTVVASVPVTSRGVRNKISALCKASVTTVSKVVSLAAGIHRGQRRTRARVAALVDYTTGLSEKVSLPNRTTRVLVVWQWGYAANPQGIAVQSVIIPPAKKRDYDPNSLVVADGLCFFSGSSSNASPCIYIAKPSQNSWSSAVVGSSPCKVTAIAVPSSNDSYIAIGFSDGSVGIWDYSPSIAAKRFGDSRTAKEVLIPLAELEARSVFAALGETKLWTGEPSETCDSASPFSPHEQFKGIGRCNHLEWAKPSPLDGSSLLMLAAAYSNGVAVFHVSLPSASNAHSLQLEPFAGARMPCPGLQNTSITWFHLGPHCYPCLAVLCDGDKVTSQPKIIMCAIELPQYSGTVPPNEGQHCPIRLVCGSKLASIFPVAQKSTSSGLVGLVSNGSIAYHCNGKVGALSPALSSSEMFPASDDPFFSSLRRPVTSEPSGLDSMGAVSLRDSAGDRDGILFVLTLTQFKARELPSPGKTGWTTPIQRHFLCRALVGDTKQLRDGPDRAASDVPISSVIGNGNETGGGSNSVVCELRCGTSKSSNSLVPHRIVRCGSTGHCAVLFRSTFNNADSVSSRVLVDPSVVALLDSGCAEGFPTAFHRDSRDIVFLSKGHDGSGRALCLSEDGSTIQLLTCQKGDAEKCSWEEGSGFRPFLGMSLGNDYSDCRRMFVVSSGSWNGLLLVGTRVKDGQSFLVCGQLVDPIDSQMDGWSNMLPNLKTDPMLWLNDGEEIVSLVELPRYENGRRCLAVATNRRVFIASSDTLEILSETFTELGCGTLASLGSHTVAFCSADFKIRYLCGLTGKFSSGVVATLPSPSYGSTRLLLLAVRPDRIMYASAYTGVQLVHETNNKDLFLCPVSITKPALLLEPLVANALCERSDRKYFNKLILVAIEKFGRKVKSLSHADDEGTGNLGSGLTPVVFEMLSFFGFKRQASWLLTGSIKMERTSNCKFLPPWAPMSNKSHAALDSDNLLQILANGDQYFSDYVKSPDQHMASSLPRSTDPSAELAREFARTAMVQRNIEGGLKLLDIAGTESSNADILHLALSLQLDPFSDNDKLLRTISGINEGGGPSVSCDSATSSIAALMKNLKIGDMDAREPKKENDSRITSDCSRRYMNQLAPSIQRGHRIHRARHRLIGESECQLALASHNETKEPDQDLWETPCDESNNIWNEGPLKEKESLLVLDRIEEWLGRCQPVILGKEGAAAAFERGEKTLADILAKALDYDDESFCGHSECSDNVRDGWIEGIGEGRTDEENLSAYFRMSEGADEDSLWRTEGLSDVTKFQHKGLIVGSPSSTSLQPTTCSVDEGEPGKVKVLCDLVFDETCDGTIPCGLALEVIRGGSLDVGILHEPDQITRKRCSIEFWYHLPPSEKVSEEIVLVRRAVSMHGEDLSKPCIASEKESLLWELVILPSGELEYRTSGGSSLLSSESHESTRREPNTAVAPIEFGDDAEKNENTKGLVSWQRQDGGGGWNHLCLLFSSREHPDPSSCAVTIMMNGEKVSAGVTTIVPPSLAPRDLADWSLVNETMGRTVLAFCINPVQGLRMTELRVWSCERSEDDCKMMMYEYLQAAEIKRKLKVKIRSRRSVPSSEMTNNRKSQGGLLAPPPRETVQPGRGRKATISSQGTQGRVDTSDGDEVPFLGGLANDFATVFDVDKGEQNCELSEDTGNSVPKKQHLVDKENKKIDPGGVAISNNVASSSSKVSASSHRTWASRVWESADPLSAAVRRSAAAALVRGPPATRHFGGNRGGLAEDAHNGRDGLKKRLGVGAIAICGSEKTVVYAYDRGAKTYPIGASGAVISDEMDSDGSEYLCCFLAKDKRMVVFEIKRKVVVVELQMTTKLNFWRYLPPQAHGHSLVFMLVTPVGGFHWSPLDDAPRPKQVWKRGPDLQGKKIIAYEEGGSNGLVGAGALSAAALLLASVSTETPVEAWVMPICGDSRAFCISSDVLGCALFRASSVHCDEEFLPHVVTAKKDHQAVITVEISSLTTDLSPNRGLGVGQVLACTKVDVPQHVMDVKFVPPTLAMGQLPEIICCCCENMIVVAIRRNGLLLVYEFTGSSLELAFTECVGHFVVDAAVHSGGGKESSIEVVLLLCDNDSQKDGRVVSIPV